MPSPTSSPPTSQPTAEPVRIAHYSDIHVTIPPPSGGALGLVSKRIMGAANYYVGGRRRHFRDVERRITALLEDIDELGVDHALCTGDITQMSWTEEFERCAELYGDRLNQPERHTVIPGNHDRYTRAADRNKRFEKYFGSVSTPDRSYPFVKYVGDVAIVALDVARAAGLLDSSGYAGDEQLARLEAILTGEETQGRYVILALHYGLLREHGGPDRKMHGIRDYERIIELVKRDDTNVDMIAHGHMHGHYEIEVGTAKEICAGSATDLHRRCGYNVYAIDTATKTVAVSRRVWNESDGVYEAE